MKEIEANKKAWGLIARDHYETFRTRLAREHSLLNDIVTRELGDLEGKRLIHLQCNTGADTISLAQLGARVTGVDLVPANVHYARRLADEFGIESARFIESDIMTLAEIHDEQYDMVFTSEGAIGWLPDLEKWGRAIRHLRARVIHVAIPEDGFALRGVHVRGILRVDDLLIPGGEITCVVGESGGRKTTLLRLLNHLVSADEGWCTTGGDAWRSGIRCGCGVGWCSPRRLR